MSCSPGPPDRATVTPAQAGSLASARTTCHSKTLACRRALSAVQASSTGIRCGQDCTPSQPSSLISPPCSACQASVCTALYREVARPPAVDDDRPGAVVAAAERRCRRERRHEGQELAGVHDEASGSVYGFPKPRSVMRATQLRENSVNPWPRYPRVSTNVQSRNCSRWAA